MENRLNNKNKLSSRLKALRIELDLTVEQAAERVKLSKTAWWNLENGRCVPNDRTLHRIRKAFPDLFKDAA